MTNQEWKRRSSERILRAVNKRGRIGIRDLKRATHYNRGPRDEDGGISLSLDLWFSALEELRKRKSVVCECDEFDNPAVVMTPVVAQALREAGASPLKQMSPLANKSQAVDNKDSVQLSPQLSPHMSPLD